MRQFPSCKTWWKSRIRCWDDVLAIHSTEMPLGWNWWKDLHSSENANLLPDMFWHQQCNYILFVCLSCLTTVLVLWSHVKTEETIIKFLSFTPVKCAFLWHAQWAGKVVNLQSVNLECALPAAIWGFSGNCPRFLKVFTSRVTILTFLLLLKCLCVRASSTFCTGPGHLRWEAQSTLTVQFAMHKNENCKH